MNDYDHVPEVTRAIGTAMRQLDEYARDIGLTRISLDTDGPVVNAKPWPRYLRNTMQLLAWASMELERYNAETEQS